MTQMALPLSTGAQLRDDGIKRVAEHNPTWMELAIDEIARLSRQSPYLTADDLRALPEPPNPNCVGAAFRCAAKQGLIRKAGYVTSQAPSAHARVIARWESVA